MKDKDGAGGFVARLSALLTPRRSANNNNSSSGGGRLQRADNAVQGAAAVVGKIEARLGRVEEARGELDKSAAAALQQIDKLFCRLAQHKRGLEGLIQGTRKDTCQPITDAANARRVLRHAVRNAQGEEGEGCGTVRHVGFALGVETGARCSGGKRVTLELVVRGGGGDAVRRALEAWKRTCRVFVVVDEKWEARAGVPSQPLPSLNRGRCNHGAAVVAPSAQVLVVGGWGQGGCLGSVERLANGSRAWEETALALPTARESCGACAVGPAVVVVGGCSSRHSGKYVDVVEAVDTAKGVCATLPSLPCAPRGCAVASVQGKVIVTGGSLGMSVVLNTAWVLDVGEDNNAGPQQMPLQWTQLARMGQPRRYHGTASGGGCVFVCGGEFFHNTIDSCEMLRVVGGTQREPGWKALPPLPEDLRSVGCCYGGGNLFVVGGYPNAQRSVLALNVGEGGWRKVAQLETGREGCTAVCVRRRVMVLGGFNHGGGSLASCEVFEF